jgi:methylglutamate dehydrogenase subunit C
MSLADPQQQAWRLESGGLIDRTRTLGFFFDGNAYSGHPGDTLASALLANGVHLVGRSFKYHRPRGILTAGSEEPNALVELRDGARREPNTRATTVELYDGLSCRSQNRWPSLEFDVMAVNSLLAPFFGAGFYYKTFMWPPAFWEKHYEPAIRRAAGLGRAARRPDPDLYERAWAHCDVLVIGSGPTGLMAALTAARTGARVILAEEDFSLGGRLLAETYRIDGKPCMSWLQGAIDELQSFKNVRLMPRTTVFGVYDQGTYGAVERVSDHLPAPPPFQPRQRLWRIVAKRAVLAAGAIERPIAFPDNDRPGVMLAGAVRTYINRFGVTPGRRAVVFTTGDDGWRTAKALAEAGVDVAAVVDPREEPVLEQSVPPRAILRGSVVTRALGGCRVEAVEVRDKTGHRATIDCDLVAVSNGWNPALHLTCHLGAKPHWSEEISAFLPATAPQGMATGGAASGRFTVSEALADGARLGEAAARAAGFVGSAAPAPPPVAEPGETAAIAPVWHVKAAQGKTFVDFQNDVTTSDIELAHREGYGAVEHLKRYTTLGMATDQGKTANVTALAVMAELTGRTIPEVGTTVFRPPFTPVSFGALAGHSRGKAFRPTRLPPSHDWAQEQGGVFAEAGLWLRAQYYRRPGETDWQRSVAREAATVRTAVGICDVSTLGKIDIQGPDAGAFLDRVYVNTLSTLAVGKVRYAVMLREDGLVMDDGTVCRLRPEHFLATTTTANAAKVLEHLDFCNQVLWPDLDVSIVPVTEQWAQISIAGPHARDVLLKLVDRPEDVSNEALPYMAFREVAIGGARCRLFRVSFSGERAYEIAVAAELGDALMRVLMQAGAAFGIAPYGTEALNVLRIEKGHASGPEIDGRTTLRDLGLAKMAAPNKDFIGRVMAERPALTDADRPVLVGLVPVNRAEKLLAGAALIGIDQPATAAHDEGHVTSVAYSPTLGHDIALGFLRQGMERIGGPIRAVDLVRGSDISCRVAHPVFIDPKGDRLRG